MINHKEVYYKIKKKSTNVIYNVNRTKEENIIRQAKTKEDVHRLFPLSALSREATVFCGLQVTQRLKAGKVLPVTDCPAVAGTSTQPRQGPGDLGQEGCKSLWLLRRTVKSNSNMICVVFTPSLPT